jgi:hypothetical protein
MRGMIGLALLLVAGVGCDGSASDSQPCDQYADYLCECHPDDPDFTCEEARAQYTNAAEDQQDGCTDALAAQQAEDEANGVCQ